MATTDQQATEREVAFEEALSDQAPDKEQPTQQGEPDDQLDILQPKREPRTWRIGKDPYTREYVQRELSFVGKMQWFALVGEVLDKAMSGPHAMSVNNLLSAPTGRGGSISIDDFRDADTFIQAAGKLLSHAPDFLEKSFCIWLSVPDYEQEQVRELMALPATEGGLSDDDGLAIIETFIDQNYEALDRFFREKLAGLRKRVEARQKDLAASRSSKR